jgi:hypothetical protein
MVLALAAATGATYAYFGHLTTPFLAGASGGLGGVTLLVNEVDTDVTNDTNDTDGYGEPDASEEPEPAEGGEGSEPPETMETEAETPEAWIPESRQIIVTSVGTYGAVFKFDISYEVSGGGEMIVLSDDDVSEALNPFAATIRELDLVDENQNSVLPFDYSQTGLLKRDMYPTSGADAFAPKIADWLVPAPMANVGRPTEDSSGERFRLGVSPRVVWAYDSGIAEYANDGADPAALYCYIEPGQTVGVQIDIDFHDEFDWSGYEQYAGFKVVPVVSVKAVQAAEGAFGRMFGIADPGYITVIGAAGGEYDSLIRGLY